MNPRIRELADQAGFDAVSIVTFDIKEDLEKFAELIIQEYSYDVMNLTSMPDHVAFAAKKWGVEL